MITQVLWKDRVHRLRKAKKYGITVNQLETLEQIASCAICDQQLCWNPKTRGSNDAVIDHCHDSGDVRGVLCRKCNSGIGFLNDDASTVRNALNYLERADKEICDD